MVWFWKGRNKEEEENEDEKVERKINMYNQTPTTKKLEAVVKMGVERLSNLKMWVEQYSLEEKEIVPTTENYPWTDTSESVERLNFNLGERLEQGNEIALSTSDNLVSLKCPNGVLNAEIIKRYSEEDSVGTIKMNRIYALVDANAYGTSRFVEEIYRILTGKEAKKQTD